MTASSNLKRLNKGDVRILKPWTEFQVMDGLKHEWY